MSWNYTTKSKVSTFSQIPQADIQDWHSDWVEKLIDDYMGFTMTATTTYTDEIHNGDGSSSLFVYHPPIVSVSALSVSDGEYTASDYKVFNEYIEIVQTGRTEIAATVYRPAVFPIGVGNVLITYIGGTTTVPKNVELAATQMVATIALVTKREGSDASLKYSKTTRVDGDTETTIQRFGLQSSLIGIMKAYLHPKVMAQ